MAAKHYRSAAKNNVLEMEETPSSQDAVQFTQCTVQDVGRRRRQSWPTLHPQAPKRVILHRRILFNYRKDKTENSKKHTWLPMSQGLVTMTQKCFRSRNWNKDTQNSCNQMT